MKVANNFARLDEQGKKILLTTGLLVAGLGPLLLIIGTLAKLLGIAALGFRILTKPLFLIIGLLPKMIAGFRALTLIMAANPLGAFVAATVTIVTYWREIIDLFKKAGNFIGGIGSKIWGALPDWAKPNMDRMKTVDYSPVDYGKGLKNVGWAINSFVGGFNNFLADRDLLPDSYLTGGRYNSPINNQKTINNNLTVNIPPGTSALDTLGIKTAIKQALQEEYRQSYIELGAQ
jgi:hypothetical protein